MEDGIPGDAFGRPPTLRNNPLNRQLSLESVNDKPDKIKKDIDAKVWTKKIVAEQKKLVRMRSCYLSYSMARP